MKYTKIFYALMILLFAAFGQSVQAQTAKKKPKLITRDELDKREVKKFVASFIKALDETKDLNSISSDFFVKDFKTRQTQSPYNFLDYDDELKQLGTDAQFEHQIALFNFSYLLMMWNGGSQNFAFAETDDNSEDEEDDNIEKLLPPDVVEILRKSPLLAESFELEVKEENKKKSLEASDLIEATAIMQNAVALLKIDIENREPSCKELYAKNIKSARKQFADYGSELCEGETCFGFPEKTRYFWQAAFPLCLHLVRENGRLKVFYIHVYTND